ncbi:MAG: MFS transporter [Alphaproteobacteria bacterium]|nr:MFS transporter [Alphaproteobacteria bacterium]
MHVFPPLRFLLIGLLGFFSGLPLALTASTLTAWLADAQVTRAGIGLFAAIATPYAFKFLWAPLLDGLRLPWLTARFGRRRSWLLVIQTLLALALAAMALTDPTAHAWMTALVGIGIATLSATQDTLIDAYRVERLPKEEQGSGAAWATFGYRIGMLVSGAGALYLADHVGWRTTYLLMAALMGSSVLLTLRMYERAAAAQVATSPGVRGLGAIPPFIRAFVVAPFRDFMTRPLWVQVLAFVVLYKLGDAFMGVMFNPFLLDLGFSKTAIAKVVKLYGLAATLLGTFAGGWLVARAGMFRALLLSGLMHMLTNLLLVVQARLGADVHFLTYSISLENFTGGMSTAAFIAYLSALCRLNYTATQYALLSSLAAFGRTWLSTPSGALAEAVGWEVFFAIASLMALPGLLLLVWIERRGRRNTS